MVARLGGAFQFTSRFNKRGLALPLPLPLLLAATLPVSVAGAQVAQMHRSPAAPLARGSPVRQGQPRIEVGPNIRVSDDGNVTHIETLFASHPTDPKFLVGTVTVQHETR